MKAHQATTSETTILAAGNYDFVHIMNNSDTTVYVKYDGDSTPVTTALGLPIVAGDTLMLNNVGPRNIFTRAITCIHGSSGNKELRIQGAQ